MILRAGMVAALLLPAAGPGQVVFRSDTALVRVDAQVVDRANRAITGLQAEDFVLREEGRPQQIRNFASEDMPVDVLLLLDVSGSMQPHVERVASAAQQALGALGAEDRVAVMVFDRSTRIRLPFLNSREDIQAALDRLLEQETFDGGTDITRALVDAAAYVAREGRRQARRAVVILTDDQTERERDETRVSRALTQAEAVLSALLAPDMSWRVRRPDLGGGWPSDPGTIIFGRRGPWGNRMPAPSGGGSRTQAAGTAEIARRSGGDSMSVDEAAALETTLARIRQRYALHFHLPEGVPPGQERGIEVELSGAARRRYPDAEVRFRRVYMSPGARTEGSAPALVSRGAAPEATQPEPQRRGGWRRADEPSSDAGEQAGDEPRRPWRRANPEDLEAAKPEKHKP